MKKKFLSLAMVLISAFALTACSDKETTTNTDTSNTNHADYACYKHEDSVDAEGHTNRTYYYINQNDSFELTFRVNHNHTSDDFICGTAIIANDALNYMRYSLIDTEGKTIVDYDKYAYFERLGTSSYFKFTSVKEGDILYGIFDEKGETITEEKYSDITCFPTDEKLFFLCQTAENTYDICKEDGTALISNVTITDVDNSTYYNRFDNEGKGLFALINDIETTLVSESTGEIIASDNTDYMVNLPDYYVSNKETGNLELFILSDNYDKALSLGSDYGSYHCYAIKDYRYIYDDTGLVVAIFDDEGNLKEQPGNVIITKLQIADTYSLLLEYEDRYSIKDSSNKELEKFDKSSYTLLSIEEYGVGFQKGDDTYVYNYDGDVILQEMEYDGSYHLLNNKHIIPIPETGTVITSDVCDRYAATIHDEYHLIQDELTKYQVLDKDLKVIFEFTAESLDTIISGTGYDFIVLKDGIYTPTGKKLEVTGLN